MSKSMRPEQTVATSEQKAREMAQRENWPAGVAGAGVNGRVVTYHYPPDEGENG